VKERSALRVVFRWFLVCVYGLLGSAGGWVLWEFGRMTVITRQDKWYRPLWLPAMACGAVAGLVLSAVFLRRKDLGGLPDDREARPRRDGE
jgi:hypothetical protein